MYLLLVILAIVALFLMEAPQLWQKKLTRDLVVFCCLLAISAYLGTAQVYGWPIPSPLHLLLPLFNRG
ncbi:MAG: hypothetical protein ACM3PA_01870 [Methanomassiliicoccales archaeon]